IVRNGIASRRCLTTDIRDARECRAGHGIRKPGREERRNRVKRDSVTPAEHGLVAKRTVTPSDAHRKCRQVVPLPPEVRATERYSTLGVIGISVGNVHWLAGFRCRLIPFPSDTIRHRKVLPRFPFILREAIYLMQSLTS